MTTMGTHSRPVNGTVMPDGHQLKPFTLRGPALPMPARPPREPRHRWRKPDGDTVIRWLAAAVVLAVAAFAAIVSYSHIFELGRHHGQDGTAARLLPLSVDGLIASASLVMLYAARNRITLKRLSWPRVMLWLGIGATVAANVLYGLPFGWLAAVVSAWPAVAFVGSVEMAVRFARDTRQDDSAEPPAVTSVTAVTPAAVPSATPARDRPAVQRPQASVKPSAIGRARAVLRDNPGLSNKDAAAKARVDIRTVQRARNGP